MSKQHDMRSPHEARLEHRMPASVALVFEAFTSPEHTRKWLPPEGLSLSTCNIDARTGGRFAWQMSDRNGPVGPLIEGEYLEAVENSRLVYTNDNGDKSPGAEPIIAELSFDEVEGETLFKCRVIFPSAEMKAEWLAQGGLDSVAEGNARMARYLAAIS